MARRVLLKFSHGLGDAAQFTVVLKHLRKFHGPAIEFDILSGRGKHSAFHGQCHASYFEGQPRPAEHTYDAVKNINWFENYNGYTDRPNSKITNCLDEEFRIPYFPELGTYTVQYTAEQAQKAVKYLHAAGATLGSDGRFRVIALHYEGNTSTAKKNLGHHHARAIIDTVAACGYRTLLLDWDHRSPHSSLPTVMNPAPGSGDIWGEFGSGDAAMLAALVAQCSGYIGIDSGPGKVASSTSTPTWIVWTGHHPLQFHDPAPNTSHLVPINHAAIPPLSGDMAKLHYFESHYNHATYKPDQLGFKLCEIAQVLCARVQNFQDVSLVRHGDLWVRVDNFDQDLVIVQDVGTGDCYRTSLYDLGEWETVVDVGAHIGVFANLVHTRNPKAKIACVEACPENIPALTANVGNYATVIHGALTYEPGELALLNAVRPACESTGGSVVVSRDLLADIHNPLRQHGYQYWDDLRPLPKISLAEVMAKAGITHIDCLKLDCEGSEYSILENAPEIDRVRFIFGEYHDHTRWEELRMRKFADWPYGKLHESDGRGLFHLVNPRFSKVATTMSETQEKPSQKSETKITESKDRIEIPARVGEIDYPMHCALRQIARAAKLGDRPKIIETGVRAGESALAFFDVYPGAQMIGYDNYSDPDSPECRERAAWNLDNVNFKFAIEDTNSVGIYPECDLFFVDGDHSFGGCLADLQKASVSSRILVVDDYDPHTPGQSVTKAVRWFLLNSPFTWNFTEVVISLNRRLAIFDRRGGQAPPEFGAPWGGVLNIATCAGVGDTAWVMTKIPDILKKLGATGCDLVTCGSDRANSYLAALPFVRRVTSCAHEILQSRKALPSGAYDYAPCQPGWHNHYDLFLQANGHLEVGADLDSWLPNVKTDYSAPVDFAEQIDDTKFADWFVSRGKYVTIFAGPLEGNTKSGHNIGGTWTPGDWAHVAHALISKGIRVVLVGYGPGDQDYVMKKLYPAGFFDDGAEDCINLWELPRTIAVLRRSSGHLGYQSGLGVLSTYFGKPTVMFWQKKGVALNETGATFSEEMSRAWVPPDMKSYYGAIYGRESPDQIAGIIQSLMKGSK